MEFNNSLVKGICEKFDTFKSQTSVYNPQCNGSVERLNRTLLSKLMKLCNGKIKEWDEFLDPALFCYRITPILRLGRCPFEILYGRSPKFIRQKETNEDNKMELEELILGMQNVREELQELARTKRSAEKLLTERNKIEHKKFKVGDIVMKKMRSFERTNKLDEKWSGPYKITRVFDNGGTEIEGFFGAKYKYNETDCCALSANL